MQGFVSVRCAVYQLNSSPGPSNIISSQPVWTTHPDSQRRCEKKGHGSMSGMLAAQDCVLPQQLHSAALCVSLILELDTGTDNV